MGTILLVVDVQTALVESKPYHCEGFIANIQSLLAMAREKGIPVCHVRHDDGEGSELTRGMRGWEIYDAVKPTGGEKIIDKRYNSAFKDTDLHAHLKALDIDRIVLAGMQTEYCIDTTCKSAFDLGYSIVIPKGCTTTVDNEWFSGEALATYFEEKIWANRFAEVSELNDKIFG